jgi:hypothetical protein
MTVVSTSKRPGTQKAIITYIHRDRNKYNLHVEPDETVILRQALPDEFLLAGFDKIIVECTIEE